MVWPHHVVHAAIAMVDVRQPFYQMSLACSGGALVQELATILLKKLTEYRRSRQKRRELNGVAMPPRHLMRTRRPLDHRRPSPRLWRHRKSRSGRCCRPYIRTDSKITKRAIGISDHHGLGDIAKFFVNQKCVIEPPTPPQGHPKVPTISDDATTASGGQGEKAGSICPETSCHYQQQKPPSTSRSTPVQ